MPVPDLPDAAEHVWGWFAQLSSARSSGGFGPNPLTFSEIAAWADLTAANPAPWEIHMLKMLDLAYLTAMRPKGGQ